ncbi:MAG: solute carrier family 23 protein [Methylovulum sp.]|nr:solute carrier family 23 protein [Methylovulum sp.]
MRKPENILYGTEDQPPLQILLILALQQMSFLGVYLVISPLFARQLGLDNGQSLQLISATLLASGFGVVLQAFKVYGIGSGYFCPLQATSSTFAGLTLAKVHGGLGAVFGMVGVVGLAQIGFAFLFQRLRSVFTVQVAGLAVLLIGLGLGSYGIKLVTEADLGIMPGEQQALLCGLTLGTMIIFNVWSSGYLRLFSAFLGLMLGFVGSCFLDVIPDKDWLMFHDAPLFYIPRPMHTDWTFDSHALLPAIITGLFLALHSFGALVAAQRFNDADWKRPDLQMVKQGILAEGVTNVVNSLLNGLPLTSSGGAVSLAASTGCTSRYLALGLAGIMVLMAFMPKAIVFWQILPLPVMGSALIFLASFTAFSGLQVIASRLLDNRKILALGIGLILGVSYEPVQRSFQHSSLEAMKTLLFSGVSLGVFAALILSVLFQIRNHTRERRRFDAQHSSLDDVIRFLELQGKSWGARHEVVHRAEYATWQAFEILTEHGLLDKPNGGNSDKIELETIFNEYTFTVILSYSGTVLPLTTHPPSHEAMLTDDSAVMQMAGYMLHRLADQVRTRHDGERCELRLIFND